MANQQTTRTRSGMSGPHKVTLDQSNSGDVTVFQKLVAGASSPAKVSPLLEQLRQTASKESTMSPSESKACPKCGKLFKPAGLVGHLYHVHGIGKADLERISGGAAVDAVGAVKRIRDLSQTLDDIRTERKALHDKDTSSSWSDRKDEPVKALLKSLDWAEGEIIKELKVLGVNFEDDKKKS